MNETEQKRLSNAEDADSSDRLRVLVLPEPGREYSLAEMLAMEIRRDLALKRMREDWSLIAYA